MDIALVTPAQATREHGLSRAGAYRNAGTLAERMADRLLVVDGRAILDPDELVAVLRSLASRAEQAEVAAQQARSAQEAMSAQLQLAAHEQELERDRAARSLAALSEIVERASTLMREQVMRAHDLR